jgi:DNA-binding protein HU-beta
LAGKPGSLRLQLQEILDFSRIFTASVLNPLRILLFSTPNQGQAGLRAAGGEPAEAHGRAAVARPGSLAAGMWPASFPATQEIGFMAKASSSKPLTKSETAAHLAEAVGITKKQVMDFFEKQADLAYKQAKKSQFVIPGIGKLVLVNRKARMGRNPQTGATIQIPAKKVVKFRVAKAAKDSILK